MKIILEDKATGIQYGVNDDGNLFLGDDRSGYNLPDTPENRAFMEQDFYRYA